MTTIYVTKYALSTGVVVMEATIDSDGYATAPRSGWYTFHKGEYALTEADAVDQFNGMRVKRIASLNKQLKKLESMKFKLKDPK